jgi:RNA polymerase sigma-19 factor, ECF subfamily
MHNKPLDIDEKEELLKLREGQPESFRILYDRYSVFIYRKLFHLCRIEYMARELTQEVFVRLWEKRQLIDPDKPIFPYLSAIAANLVVDFFRKAARDRKLKASLLSRAEKMSDNISERLIASDERTMLRNAISCLPAQQQSVFQLCKVEGLSHEEVSDKLGISISTVNNHIVKANKTVKRYLIKYLSVLLPFSFFSYLFLLFFTRK